MPTDADQVKIRKGATAAIKSAISGYDITTATVEETYFPRENLEDLADAPKIKVVALGIGANRDRNFRSKAVVLTDPAVQIAVQQYIQRKDDTATIDSLVRLVEQVMDTVEDDELVANENFSWARTEPLKDENGLIYSYDQLWMDNVFQSIFSVFYTKVKP